MIQEALSGHLLIVGYTGGEIPLATRLNTESTRAEGFVATVSPDSGKLLTVVQFAYDEGDSTLFQAVTQIGDLIYVAGKNDTISPFLKSMFFF